MYSSSREPYFHPPKNDDSGTQLQARAWALASSSVVEYITLIVSMSEHRQGFLDLKLRDRLTVADAIILHQRLGYTKAADFVSVVDPWCYPDDDAPSQVNVKSYLQSVVDKAASLKIFDKTEASITEFLVSPLLVKKGRRPSLLRQPKVQQSNPSPKIVVMAAATVSRKPLVSPAVDFLNTEGQAPPPHTQHQSQH